MNDPVRPGTEILALLVARETDGIRRRSEPVRCGVPLPRGTIRRAQELALDGQRGPIPVQAETLDTWPDGSVRWALLDFALDLEAGADARLTLRSADGGEPRTSAMLARTTDSGVFVETGPARFAIDRGKRFPFRSAQANGVEVLGLGGGLRCTTADGRTLEGCADQVTVECAGPVRATVLVNGTFRDDAGKSPLDFTARLHFFAGHATVRLDLTVHNPRAATHPGGHWELGDAGSFLFRELSLVLPVREASHVSWSADPSAPLADAGTVPFRLHQDSSGGENWQSRVHRARGGFLSCSFRGYHVRVGDTERTGRRATPRVALHDGRSGVSVSVRQFWENFPKALDVRDGCLALELFPSGPEHELQGGERKTHEFALTFGSEALAENVDGFRRPLIVHATPATFVESRAIPYLTRREDDPNETYLALVNQALEGDDTFATKRERADEYGWRNFGDLWADHEAVESDSPDSFVSHFNNQYDPVYGAFVQFARSGDERWFRLMEDLARHVSDIDVYHTTEDRSAYNGGLFWHTAHYVDADLSTHRTYPKRGPAGGGPDNEHDYATGFAHYYFLTGDPLGREAAIGLADWILARDDGHLTIFRWLDRGPTGLATKTRDPDYHGPGRGAGNSVQTLLDAWQLTGADRYLTKCHEVIRRTIHPADDVPARDLLDAENRWSYTVYLQALGRYLDTMADAGRLDEHYSYARESLLTYARWMVEHETLTLDHPNRLEYPTETWAAQDIRKSEVLQFAALHSSGDERTGFLERARWFHEEAVRALDGFPTKATTRPVALMMRYGWMDAWFRLHPDDSRPAGPAIGFPDPEVFVPQKARAVAKAIRIAAAGGVVLVALVAVLVARLI